MSVHRVGEHEQRFALYASIVDVLDGPAAIVDETGSVLHRNRWVEGSPDRPLLYPDADLNGGVCEGADGSSRWRVRRVGSENLLLVTLEQGEADHLLRMFYSGSDSLFAVYDHRGRIVEANDAWERLLGYPPSAVVGLDSWSLVLDEDKVTRAAVEKELRETGQAEPSWRMRHADGSERVVLWRLRFDRRVGRCFAIGREAAAERRGVDELYRRAYTDPLTGLANRVRLVAELDRASVEGVAPAVLFCDLDGFKAVNDSLGHRAGDELLAELGRRLNVLAQRGGDVVARIGGDEFVVLLPTATLEEAIARAEIILDDVRRPFAIDGRDVRVGISIGVAAASASDPFEAKELLRHADMAAYEAKRTGRGRVVVFGDELRASIERRISVEAQLRSALEHEAVGRTGSERIGLESAGFESAGFEVFLQPIVALPGKGTIGVEALMRWRDTSGTIHRPVAFADVALKAGLMPAIGGVVMGKALDAVGPIHRAGRPLMVTLNAAGTELAAEGFVDRFMSSIAAAGVDPSLVVLEVTETTALAEDGVIAEVLAEVRAAGVRIALDDFGTGHSSLWHLRKFPVDILKIDRSFVRDLVDDPTTRTVTAAIVNLCRELGIDVIVEGVETADQASAVEQVGASLAQGFLFYKPMPVNDLHRLLGMSGPASKRRAALPPPLQAIR